MKKTVMRALSVLSIAAIGLTLTACGKDDGEEESVSIFSRPTVERVVGQKKEWNDVSSFVCYYGSLSANAEAGSKGTGTPVSGGPDVKAIDRLKEFDVAIIHSSSLYTDADSEALVKELQASGTYVLAYVSIGEDGTEPKTGDGLGENGYASYYFYENGQPKKNPAWGSYFVDAGNPVWQQTVLNKAEKAYSYGVDGLFLDTVDVVDVAYDTIGGMVDLIKKFDETFPDAKIVPNRGFTVYPYISQYIDGVMFESFSSNYDLNTGYFVDRDEDGLKYNQTIACNVINRARRYDYMPVFCLEYVNAEEYSYLPQGYYDNAWKYDFIPYATYSRQLDVCPNPGVVPASKRGELALEYFSDSNGEISSNGDTSANNLAYAGNGLCTVTVDSTFQGYSGAKPINDGVYTTKETHDQSLWATIAWASSNDAKKDHYIQFTFGTEQDISKVNVYWAVDNGTIYSAREACIQVSDDGRTWTTVSRYSWKNGSEYLLQQQSTTFEFDTVKTKYVRVFQPKNMGDATSSRTDGQETQFSGIMWVGEVEIYN